MMQGTTSNAQDVSYESDIRNTMIGDGPSAPTTEAGQQEMGTIDTPEKCFESGLDEHAQKILAGYDRIGSFELKRLQVEVIESGLSILDRHKFLSKDVGKLITIGAHTSHGKSALLMQIAAYVSQKYPVIVHSFEMSREEIETRLLAAFINSCSTFIQEGRVSESKLKFAREEYAKRRLYVSNVQNRSLGYVMSSIYELSKVVGRPGLVVIDYGQQIKPGSGSRDTPRVVEITDISAGLLQLAQQLKCNVLIGAQLNNEILRRASSSKDEEGNMHYIPSIADIREGSSIAHDSSTLLMVVRPYVFNRNANKEEARFYCVKNRGGELWDADVKWDGPRCQFFEGGVGL